MEDVFLRRIFLGVLVLMFCVIVFDKSTTEKLNNKDAQILLQQYQIDSLKVELVLEQEYKAKIQEKYFILYNLHSELLSKLDSLYCLTRKERIRFRLKPNKKGLND